MARAETVTLLPLDSWAKIMGINLFEFNQIGEGFPVDNNAQCDHVWFQYQWQEDFLSREEIAGAIASAENMIAQHCLFWPAPKAFIDPVKYPRPARRELYGGGVTNRGDFKAVRLQWGKVISGGIYKREAINLAVAVVLSDPDGDSVDELFTLTVPTSVTDTDEIAVYFKGSDRLGESVSEMWRLRPVKVSISGGTATITGHSSLLVKPLLTTVTNPEILNVTDATNYITEVEVYRLYVSNDTTASEQGVAIWDENGCEVGDCENQQYPICIYPRNAEYATVAVNFALDGICVDREPDRLSVNYIAGQPLVNGQMEPQLAKMIAYLATALLPVGSCACDRSNRILAYWREVAPAAGEGLQQVGNMRGDFEMNPFGPQRGAIWAWNRVQEIKQQWASTI